MATTAPPTPAEDDAPPSPPLTPLPPPTAPRAPIERYIVEPTPGEVITTVITKNRFLMGEKIGEGNFGVVYACTDVWNNELAAKVFKPHGTYERVQAAVMAEFAKLRELRHPYITFVHDAFVYRDTFYIVTERCAGSIAQILFALEGFDGPLWLMGIARCLLQAVQYLHMHDYVHQDIHSGNVFTSLLKDEYFKDGPDAPNVITFKLGDLGVARLLAEVDATNTRAEWMLPPEVLDPQEYGPLDHRIDIYHVGLLLLQIALSKEIQFTKAEILEGKPREIALALRAPYSFALEKALRRHVEYRTASAQELWRDLNTPA
jgi:serine/threonine protein kinase